jgi:glycosyltransferase involved in cell wall biosynthesis
MDRRPLVSIGVPVYNREQSVRLALDSLLAQTYEHLEIVVCDNASTDGTGEVCQEYAARDPRVRYERNKQNIGCIPNFNRVLELATGDFFTWTASDDVRPPTAIQKCVEALERNPEAVMAHGPVLLAIDGQTELVPVSNTMDLTSRNASQRVRTFTRKMQQNAILYGLHRRETLCRLRSAVGSCYGQDYLFALKQSFAGPVEWVSTPMLVYCQKPNCSIENPMYDARPFRPRELLTYRGVRRNKGWTVLILGCHAILTCPARGIGERLKGVAAYALGFGSRHRRELANELLFLVFTPVAWLVQPFVPAGRRLRTALTRDGVTGG